MKNNIDDAFMRRFNVILKFTIPEADDRAKIWKLAFLEDVLFVNENQESIDIPELVKNYIIPGGSIVNVVHYSSLKAIQKLQGNKSKKYIYL